MKLLIIGAGGYGNTVADVAKQLNCFEKIAFLDDTKSGSGVLGRCEEYAMFCDEDTAVYPAFGDNALRMEWLEVLMEEGLTVPTLVHPSAYVSPTAVLGEGTVVLPKAVVNTGVTVGVGCLINIGALVDHDTVIEDGVHLAPGAIVKAKNRIAAFAKINSGEVIENGQFPL
jgi:UDP-N-acetylbacillosamine N-acetyltransferase